MPTIYVEAGLPASLIPVQFLGWAKSPIHGATGCWNAVVRLKRNRGAYRTGEVIHTQARHVVVRAGRRDYHTLVRPADLPERTEANTLPCRW